MKKKVNVHPNGRPITALALAIRSDLIGAEMDTEDIKKIILQKGTVEEVFADGSTIKLNLSNYDKPNLFADALKAKEAEEEEAKQRELEEARQAEILKQREAAKQAAIDDLKDPKKDEVKDPEPEKKDEVKDPEPEKKDEVKDPEIIPQPEEEAVRIAREKALAKEKANGKK